MKHWKYLILILLVISSSSFAERMYYSATAKNHAGHTIVYRALDLDSTEVIKPDYPTLVSIHWPYKIDNERGMPESSVIDAQYALEDLLIHLDVPEKSHLVLVVTGSGNKTWNWYVKDLPAWKSAFNEALKNRPIFPISLSTEMQPKWSLFVDFQRMVGKL